ncbi:glycosyltransferase family 2 protein [Algoriphagus sediminis]|uniref:Glycosyltransferase family 2 protein n=1 Tax=Algoriphagus sediminis TaxID=3057113 RepID=A0ABT7YGX2_9BACT|nr:glycosyltransferase family 2 protein [Algoriphagus sediminis]MDN3205723.1 glycosyltransferase family 2 protein [Algoriphagus sediminis]
MKSCAIVILNFNGAEVLPKFLSSVVKESQNDIWVIDNASEDNSLEFLESDYPQIQLIKLEKNLGFAGGYNRGLGKLKDLYEYYILLNSDVEVTPEWDQLLLTWLDSQPNYACVQPKILSFQNRVFFDYAGAAGGFLDFLGYPYCRGRIWETIEKDTGQYNQDLEVDWASGACMAVRANLFHDLGGFDEQFFAHMEEIDLCWRLRAEGWKVGFHSRSVVYHFGGATLSRSSPSKLHLNIRNSLLMLHKNLKSDFWLRFLPKAALEFSAALNYLIKGEKESSKAIRQGYSDFFKMRDKNIKSVKTNAPIKSTGPATVIFWDYFIRGRKTFLEL